MGRFLRQTSSTASRARRRKLLAPFGLLTAGIAGFACAAAVAQTLPTQQVTSVVGQVTSVVGGVTSTVGEVTSEVGEVVSGATGGSGGGSAGGGSAGGGSGGTGSGGTGSSGGGSGGGGSDGGGTAPSESGGGSAAGSSKDGGGTREAGGGQATRTASAPTFADRIAAVDDLWEHRRNADSEAIALPGPVAPASGKPLFPQASGEAAATGSSRWGLGLAGLGGLLLLLALGLRLTRPAH